MSILAQSGPARNILGGVWAIYNATMREKAIKLGWKNGEIQPKRKGKDVKKKK